MGFHLQCETVENIAATLMNEITIKKIIFPSPKQSKRTADLEKTVLKSVTEGLQGEVALLLKIYGAN